MSGRFRWARAPHGGLPSQHPWAEDSRGFKKRLEALSRLSCRGLIVYHDVSTIKKGSEKDVFCVSGKHVRAELYKPGRCVQLSSPFSDPYCS